MKGTWIKLLKPWKGFDVGTVRHAWVHIAEELILAGIAKLASDPSEPVIVEEPQVKTSPKVEVKPVAPSVPDKPVTVKKSAVKKK